MRVMIVSSNRLKVPVPAFPSGPAYVAGAALQAGHQVEVFDCCFSEDVRRGLDERIKGFNPDVTGISIRNVNSGTMLDHRDFREEVKEVVDRVKRSSSAPLVLGGPGFNNFGREWLEYLGLDMGIRGEGESSFPLYLERLEEGGDIHDIPGCVFREGGDIHEIPRQEISDLDATPFPAFELLDIEDYVRLGSFPAVFTKRGCPFRCSYCPISIIEGARYRLKSPKRVVDELERVQKTRGISKFFFCDNVFNFPRDHAEAVCGELIERGLGVTWSTDSLTPLGLTEDFCRLMKEAGGKAPNLCVESGSSRMLERMNRGYGKEHVREAITGLNQAELPFTITLLLGGPGETPETISETLDLIDGLPGARLVFATVGLCLEHNQRILDDARRDGQLEDDGELFKGAYYLSPDLPREYVDELVASIKERDGWFISVAD